MKKLLLLAVIATTLASCSSSKKPVNRDVEIEVPCSGLEFQTDDKSFRASGSGVSSDQVLANKKAMTNANAALAASIETQVKTVTDSYLSSYDVGVDEEVRGRYQTLTRETVNQTLQGVKVICTKMFQGRDGKYKSYVALELGSEKLLENFSKRISADEKLRTDFEYEKFKKVFEKEMAEMAK